MRRDKYNQEDMRKSATAIAALAQKEVEILGDPKKVFIGGLSQGCAITLGAFLTFNGGVLGGIVGMIGV